MTKNTWLLITLIAALLILTVSIILASRPAPQNAGQDMLNLMEASLGVDWKKQTVTEVSDLVYSDAKGNTIIYYICFTTYDEEDPKDQTDLNINAIASVINTDEAESCRECTVSNHPAAIFQKDGRAYLCWTITPELSCVIQYDPTVENEVDMFRMAESIPANVRN